MRQYDQGAFMRVTMSPREVEDWADRWPCSGLCLNRGVSFTFDKRNGDLVDSNDQERHPFADGGAVVALSEDCQHYAGL